ncbi:MAG: hypothetical protein M1127_00925 [Patescibacteria group bacterium]|nr:hypothetical protein [Patescibacteria group bacterium]
MDQARFLKPNKPNNGGVFVVNSKGEQEPFSFKKVSRSAQRAGANRQLAQKIAAEIEKRVYPGAATSVIFNEVRKLLRGENPAASLRFNLKQAMKDLGPTGFPFEKYVAAVLGRLGYQVKINQFISGAWLKNYEIDFIAKKGDVLKIGECKYRREAGGSVDQEIALANFARFLDIQNNLPAKRKNPLQLRSFLITNAKFTSRAAKYCRAAGVELLGWNYPKNRGLEYLIEENGLYPITILPSLKRYFSCVMARCDLMLATDVLKLNVEQFSRTNNLDIRQLAKLVQEAEILLQ